MGGISPIASKVGSFAGSLGSLATSFGSAWNTGKALVDEIGGNSAVRRQQQVERDQLQRNQQAQMDAFSADVARQRDQMKTNAAVDERRRVDALRRAMARTKVNMAGQGIDPSDTGSSEAILLGQIKDTETDRQEAQTIDNLRQRALDDSIANQNRQNLLEAANLYDRQRLQLMRG